MRRCPGTDQICAGACHVRESSIVEPCTKISFKTPGEASRVLEIVAKKQAERGRKAPRSIHPCTTCHAWHLTSKPARTNAAR